MAAEVLAVTCRYKQMCQKGRPSSSCMSLGSSMETFFPETFQEIFPCLSLARPTSCLLVRRPGVMALAEGNAVDSMGAGGLREQNWDSVTTERGEKSWANNWKCGHTFLRMYLLWEMSNTRGNSIVDFQLLSSQFLELSSFDSCSSSLSCPSAPTQVF